MEQHEIEVRPDWQKIAMSVQCPTCFAPIGTACMERSMSLPKARSDFHSTRKQAAKSAWELKRIEELDERIEKIDEHIEKDLDKIFSVLVPRLSFIKISFTKGDVMAEGPVTLQQGQSATSTIDYYDQNGNLMSPSATFTPPTVTYTIDNPAFCSSVPQADGQSDLLTWVSAGVANLTGTVQGPNGVLSDTETVTCQPPIVTAPFLSSIKINTTPPFTSAPPAAAAAVKK